jgi:hypothetical protein
MTDCRHGDEHPQVLVIRNMKKRGIDEERQQTQFQGLAHPSERVRSIVPQPARQEVQIPPGNEDQQPEEEETH